MNSDSELLRFERMAETAYEAMYSAVDSRTVKSLYEDACTHYSRAIEEARRLNLKSAETRLTNRLSHIRVVYDHQFRWI